MRILVALCLVFGCSGLPADFLSHVGLPAVVQSKVAEGDDTMPADVTKLSVTQLGLPLTYLHGIPTVSATSLSVPAAVITDDDSDEITTAVHAIPYFGAAAVPAVSTATVETEQKVSAIKYVQPFGNVLPYINFGYNNYYNPRTYSHGGYPYHFGYPYNFGYTTYAAVPSEGEDSSMEEED